MFIANAGEHLVRDIIVLANRGILSIVINESPLNLVYFSPGNKFPEPSQGLIERQLSSALILSCLFQYDFQPLFFTQAEAGTWLSIRKKPSTNPVPRLSFSVLASASTDHFQYIVQVDSWRARANIASTTSLFAFA